MWVINEEGSGVNLSRFDAIYVDSCQCVMASRIECDEDYREVSNRLKKFENENDAKNYIVELVKKLNEEQAKKTVTYGDVLKATYGEHFTPQKSQSDGVSIEEAPVVVIARIKESADSLG